VRRDAVDLGEIFLGQNRIRRTIGHHCAGVEQNKPAAPARRQTEIMQRYENDPAVPRHIGKDFHQSDLMRRIKSGIRLVGQQRRRRLRQGAGRKHPRALAAR
jgi:hypothetical protein